MAIAHVATEYVFSDFLLKDPTEAKYKGVRLELAVDKIVAFLAVGLPLFLISLAFAQEVSVGESVHPHNLSGFFVAVIHSIQLLNQKRCRSPSLYIIYFCIYLFIFQIDIHCGKRHYDISAKGDAV